MKPVIKPVTTLSPYLNINRIEFVVTYQCSGKCIHCSVGDRLNQADGHYHVRIPEAVNAIEWLADHYAVSSVMTFGGEPLLYPDVVCAIHSTAASCGIEARQLITNGYFSKEEQRIGEVAQALKSLPSNSIAGFRWQTLQIDNTFYLLLLKNSRIFVTDNPPKTA